MKDWILQKIQEFYDFLIDALINIPLHLFKLFMDGLAFVIESIPAPQFIQGFSLNNYIPTEILWFLYMSEFDTCLGIIGAGISFYFLRRIVTIGIW